MILITTWYLQSHTCYLILVTWYLLPDTCYLILVKIYFHSLKWNYVKRLKKLLFCFLFFQSQSTLTLLSYFFFYFPVFCSQLSIFLIKGVFELKTLFSKDDVSALKPRGRHFSMPRQLIFCPWLPFKIFEVLIEGMI